MKLFNKRNGEDNMVFILICIIVTGIVFRYRMGINGNDFWWHVKTGEWILANHAVPKIGIFSWYAKENAIEWVSHEWLSEIFFFAIYKSFSDGGIFILSVCSALGMAMLIIRRNMHGILNNSLISIIYLISMVFLFPLVFYGRPQLLSVFLLYFTLVCLYQFRDNQDSKTIFWLPIISMLWSNFHGGSSNLPYIMCLIFLLSGVFEFSCGKLAAEKSTKKQLIIYTVIISLSTLAIAVNPHGFKMILYPYTNIGDSFMQSIISEWQAPDGKNMQDLLFYFYPVFIVGISLIMTNEKIKFVDLLIFLFFSYLLFRSIRFSGLFFIASTFFTFDYLLTRKVKPITTKMDAWMFAIIIIILLGTNIFSIKTMINANNDGKLISSVLEEKFIALVQKESPQRLYNDYNFGETLIFNNIDTFIDARADIFSANSLRDAINLLLLLQLDEEINDKIFDPEEVIYRYGFDAFLIESNRSLSSYLKSHPEKYELVMGDEFAVYFKCIE